MPTALLRAIPKVDLLLGRAEAAPDLAAAPRVHLLTAVRRALDELRRDILAGRLKEVPGPDDLLAVVRLRLAEETAPSLRPVVNATGVVLHTNLGRSILGEAVAARVAEVAASYSNLEYDLRTGERGSRQAHVESLLTRLTGGAAALAVNNNAAALLLIMAAVCGGREVIVSRGELVEIGDSFRLPEILAQGGVTLREVGATNRTTLEDYAKAIWPERSGCLLKVHPSNFRLIGYTGQPTVAELASLAGPLGLPLICDVGSGALGLKMPGEPDLAEVLGAGADLVCFSGDKLLGGPQAGLVVGRADLVARLKTHPLARALRLDKLCLAALEATLRLHLDPDRAGRNIPTLAMLKAEAGELRARAESLRTALAAAAPTLDLAVVEAEGQAGGGAAPEYPLKSWAVALAHPRLSAERLEAALRRGETPVLGRIHRERLLLDPRTIRPDQFPLLAGAVAALESLTGGE
ncbi:MAG: L-seryl-tRNA(Sec) selenium transferase [Candidatus Adiutrix sp.]|jgi:L-seryl-tRNA(Ser) seleniumtransferase|nr:L-seryl-tRNA(Sec) selenium transferase [Candidatus Adiutrix sp.]